MRAHRTVHLVVSSFYPDMEIPLVCTINTATFAFMDFFFLFPPWHIVFVCHVPAGGNRTLFIDTI